MLKCQDYWRLDLLLSLSLVLRMICLDIYGRAELIKLRLEAFHKLNWILRLVELLECKGLVTICLSYFFDISSVTVAHHLQQSFLVSISLLLLFSHLVFVCWSSTYDPWVKQLWLDIWWVQRGAIIKELLLILNTNWWLWRT
jgi:hypothetical protein